jgi:hypothetical protein
MRQAFGLETNRTAENKNGKEDKNRDISKRK